MLIVKKCEADSFNNFFSSIPNQTLIDGEVLNSCNCAANENHPSTSINFSYEQITAFEIYRLIMSLDNSLSSCSFSYCNVLIKQISFYIVDVLCFLFNMSLDQVIFPSSLKHAEIIPIHKKGSKSDISNYRPISLLPVFSKLLEKVFKIRMVNFLNKISFFNDKQYGFREGKSTDQALLKFCNEVWNGINEKNFTMALFIDITKAFDTVDHGIFLLKLHNCGFRGNSYNWLKSYLANRTQRVKVGNSFSEESKLSLGVPQGSVLGPVLFLIYINSIFDLKLNSNITGFADDMSCTFVSKSLLDLTCKVNSDLETLRHWFKCHKLVVSIKKKLILFNPFGLKFNISDYNFIFHGACCKKFLVNKTISSDSSQCETFNEGVSCSAACFKIEFVTSFRYLGVIIDYKINWKNHISELRLYLRKCTRQLFALKNFCSSTVLKTIYFALCHSKINYGLICWGSAFNIDFDSILLIQKHLIRIVCGSIRYDHSFPLFASLKILPLRQLYYFNILRTFFQNFSHNNLRMTSQYNLRSISNNDVVIPSHRYSKLFYA